MRVRIELVVDEHEARVQELASDPAIAATSNVPSPYPPDGARNWIAHTQEMRRQSRLYAFAIVTPADGLVGVCSLMGVERSRGTASLGYWVGRPYWGRGYATAGAGQVLAFGFDELELERVCAHCLTQNVASARVLVKLGFVASGPGPADPRGETLNFVLRRAAPHQAERPV